MSTPETPLTLLWFRQDLRLADQPALQAAVEAGDPVVPLFIDDAQEQGHWAPGAARRWWLHHSLARLGESLERLGTRLVIRQGSAQSVLDELIDGHHVVRVLWNRRYEPALIERDRRIKQRLGDRGIEVRSFNGHLLYEPWEVQTKTGGPYKVYSPFWRMCRQLPEPERPAPAPPSIPTLEPHSKYWPESLSLDDLALLPSIRWDEGFHGVWTPGEAGADQRLERFLHEAVDQYGSGRDFPGCEHVSRLSPHLHHGEISPRQVWWAVADWADDGRTNAGQKSANKYLAELGWREFGYHLLYHFPHTTDQPLNQKFADFPWADPQTDDDTAEALRAWQRGRTGYPIVDAGMRQLWATGWMHNRVRMIVASFLVKDLRINWVHGAKWFWDTLVDADLANNTMGWQWAGGCGADAAPYFRIFNPVLQGERFDADGGYVARWCPELARLDEKKIHKPWEAGPLILETAGLSLGEDYPHRIIDHGRARDAALAAFEKVKTS